MKSGIGKVVAGELVPENRAEYEARCNELESDIMDLQASQQPKRYAKGRFI